MKTRFKYDYNHFTWKLLFPITCPVTGLVYWTSPGEAYTYKAKLHLKHFYTNLLDK